jgi:hypothetical protein
VRMWCLLACVRWWPTPGRFTAYSWTLPSGVWKTMGWTETLTSAVCLRLQPEGVDEAKEARPANPSVFMAAS